MPASSALAILAVAPLALPVAARADAVVDGSHRTELLDCAGAAAVVNGDANNLVFHGKCASLALDGAGNTVEIDLAPGGALRVSGNGNHVLFTPIVPGPVIVTIGSDNAVAAGSGGAASAALAPPIPDAPPPPVSVAPPEAPRPGTLFLRGDGITRMADCAGRNVLIEGSDSRITLTGGCRSVTVQGHADTIVASLQPGARIAIAGDGVTLHYDLAAPGAAPIVSVTGRDSGALRRTGANR